MQVWIFIILVISNIGILVMYCHQGVACVELIPLTILLPSSRA